MRINKPKQGRLTLFNHKLNKLLMDYTPSGSYKYQLVIDSWTYTINTTNNGLNTLLSILSTDFYEYASESQGYIYVEGELIETINQPIFIDIYGKTYHIDHNNITQLPNGDYAVTVDNQTYICDNNNGVYTQKRNTPKAILQPYMHYEEQEDWF